MVRQSELARNMAACDANYIRLLKLVPQLRGYKNGNFCHPNTGVNRSLGSKGDEPEKILEGTGTRFYTGERKDSAEKVIVDIKILEAFKYTTTLHVTQRPEISEWVTTPSIVVRIYHDAKTSEVIAFQGESSIIPMSGEYKEKMPLLREKNYHNSFLGEWLAHCLKLGRAKSTFVEQPYVIKKTDGPRDNFASNKVSQ
ncbi:DUF1249 domain-containing protein [OM182 bacterium]|nr:DUF1249 domain-containing protein [OM182 bacterium]